MCLSNGTRRLKKFIETPAQCRVFLEMTGTNLLSYKAMTGANLWSRSEALAPRLQLVRGHSAFRKKQNVPSKHAGHD